MSSARKLEVKIANGSLIKSEGAMHIILTMEDFPIKETTPNIPATNDSMLPKTALDIVEQMDFLFGKSEVSVEVDLLQERNEAGSESNVCNIPTKVRSILDNEGHLEIKKRAQKVTCQKVSPMLKRNKRSKDYFDPRVISFGPYHLGKPEFQEAKTLKTDVILEFIVESSTSFVEFYSKYVK
nr:hypothetical protein CFP56_36870 [Quercus suber]